MIDKISFTNYKSFKDNQELDLKPITVLIGKNSSGKSAVAKLPTLLENSLSGKTADPLLTTNNGVELGAEFRDLIYGREIGSLEFKLQKDTDYLFVEVTSGVKDNDLPRIRKWQYNDEVILQYNDANNNYKNLITQEELEPIFSGLNFEAILHAGNVFPGLVNLEEKGITLNANYIGPFRKTPQRTYNSIGNTKALKVGIAGENAYQILISDYLYNDRVLLTKVSKWYQDNFAGWGVQVNVNSRPDYKIELFRESPAKFNVNICDVGQGMSQALPLIVSAFLHRNEQLLTIIEQPELHLHPAAHGNLAELFVESIGDGGKFLIETHSQNFVLRLRRLVAEGKLDENSIQMYYVDYDEERNISELKKIIIHKDGSVEYWPENIFTESLSETIAIKKATQV